MKVEIRVWEREKLSDQSKGMPRVILVKYDNFQYPEIITHGIPIERCQIEYNNALVAYFDNYPARIDADPRFGMIHILDSDTADSYPEGYTLLDADKGKAIILWTRPKVEA